MYASKIKLSGHIKLSIVLEITLSKTKGNVGYTNDTPPSSSGVGLFLMHVCNENLQNGQGLMNCDKIVATFDVFTPKSFFNVTCLEGIFTGNERDF